jgi:hypothetical protein
MYIFALMLALVNFMVACKTTNMNQESSTKDFFDNSFRRVATIEEMKPILQVMLNETRKCTGFVVAKEGPLDLFITARHCGKYDMAKWCNKDEGQIQTADGKIKAKCLYVIASDADLECVLLQADKPLGDKGYRLADFVPKEGASLRMIGYPCDGFAKDISKTEPIATENCWVTSNELNEPKIIPVKVENKTETKTETSEKKDKTENSEKAETTDIKKTETTITEPVKPTYRTLRHNCTSYGGNSGGPMMREGTDIVYAIPKKAVTWLISIYNSTNLRFGVDVKFEDRALTVRGNCTEQQCHFPDGMLMTWTAKDKFSVRDHEQKVFTYTCSKY